MLELFLSELFELFFVKFILEILFIFFFVDLIPFGDFLNHIENFLGDLLIDDFESLRLD